MENSPKYLFIAILLIPVLLVYVYFFNEDKTNQAVINSEKINQNFDFKSFKDVFEKKDYEITQITNSYALNSKLKDKPEVSATRKMYTDNGVLIAATLNIDNSILNIYTKDDLRTYVFNKDKTYFITNSDPYGDKLKSISEDNAILAMLNDINNHTDVKKLSEFRYEYLDYITEKLNQNTKVDTELYEKVYREKKKYTFEFDSNSKLLLRYKILSLDGKYILGSQEFKYKEISQEAIEKTKTIPSGYVETKE